MKFLQTTKKQLYIIVLVCLLVNINTISNQYALDDAMVIEKNMFVQKGFAGITEILSTDAYKSYFIYEGKDDANISGGRFRPLSIISFAIEQSIFGKTLGKDYLTAKEQLVELEQNSKNYTTIEQQRTEVKRIDNLINEQNLKLAPIRHFFQIIYYTLCCLCMFWFIKLIFPQIAFLPFFSTLLFAVHPIHTEVVANLKSRDEIFSLLFIFLTFIQFIQFFSNAKNKHLILALLFYLLALLSKEYAFVLPILITAYYYITSGKSYKVILQKPWLYLISLTTILFFFYRFIITNAPPTEVTDVVNNPYLFAESSKILPSKISTWLVYLQLLCIPINLSCDYSYNTFPYVTWTNGLVIFSIFLWTSISICTILLILKRRMFGFLLLWFMLFFLLINNLFFDIGATMGERLIFHSSVAFCILVVALIFKLINGRVLIIKYSIVVLGFCVLIFLSIHTILRNSQWKNNFVLFTTDVAINNNSIMLNSNAGSQYFEAALLPFNGKVMTKQDSLQVKPLLIKSLGYTKKCTELNANFFNAQANLALTYFYLNNLDSAFITWKKAASIINYSRNNVLTKHAALLLSRGLDYGIKKDYLYSIKLMQIASVIDPYNPSIWNNLGGACYMISDFGQAYHAFKKAIELNPNLQDAKSGLNAASYQLSLQKRN